MEIIGLKVCITILIFFIGLIGMRKVDDLPESLVMLLTLAVCFAVWQL